MQGSKADHPLDLRSLGLAIKQRIVHMGGACLPLLQDGTLTIYAHGIDDAELKSLLDVFVVAGAKRNATLTIMQRQGSSEMIRAMNPDYRGPGAIIREKLTRKFFLGLEPGAYIVSNIYNPTGQPSWCERVGRIEERLERWNAIPRQVKNRLCDVYWTKQEVDAAIS